MMRKKRSERNPLAKRLASCSRPLTASIAPLVSRFFRKATTLLCNVVECSVPTGKRSREPTELSPACTTTQGHLIFVGEDVLEHVA